MVNLQRNPIVNLSDFVLEVVTKGRQKTEDYPIELSPPINKLPDKIWHVGYGDGTPYSYHQKNLYWALYLRSDLTRLPPEPAPRELFAQWHFTGKWHDVKEEFNCHDAFCNCGWGYGDPESLDGGNSIRYLYELRNEFVPEAVLWQGSSCIQHFYEYLAITHPVTGELIHDRELIRTLTRVGSKTNRYKAIKGAVDLLGRLDDDLVKCPDLKLIESDLREFCTRVVDRFKTNPRKTLPKPAFSMWFAMDVLTYGVIPNYSFWLRDAFGYFNFKYDRFDETIELVLGSCPPLEDDLYPNSPSMMLYNRSYRLGRLQTLLFDQGIAGVNLLEELYPLFENKLTVMSDVFGSIIGILDSNINTNKNLISNRAYFDFCAVYKSFIKAVSEASYTDIKRELCGIIAGIRLKENIRSAAIELRKECEERNKQANQEYVEWLTQNSRFLELNEYLCYLHESVLNYLPGHDRRISDLPLRVYNSRVNIRYVMQIVGFHPRYHYERIYLDDFSDLALPKEACEQYIALEMKGFLPKLANIQTVDPDYTFFKLSGDEKEIIEVTNFEELSSCREDNRWYFLVEFTDNDRSDIYSRSGFDRYTNFHYDQGNFEDRTPIYFCDRPRSKR